MFLCDELGFTDLLFSVQPNPFCTTEAYHPVPPISQQEKQFATYSVFLLIQLHSMNLVLYKHHIYINALCCDSRIKPFLEIDVKGGERDHIKAYREREYHLLRGRKRSPGGENTQVESISQGSQILGVQEERCHMSFWGKDMFICAYLH